MYRAIYDYKSEENGSFNITVGDVFWFVQQHDSHWWRMRDKKGNVGLVPASYLVSEEEKVLQLADGYRIF